MKGERIADGTFPSRNGQYSKSKVSVAEDGSPVWYVKTPNGNLGTLALHSVTEHEDGTITVSPSILVTTRIGDQDKELWHGFLENGVWREV